MNTYYKENNSTVVEFLMSYGWAIMATLIAIIISISFGIFDTDKLDKPYTSKDVICNELGLNYSQGVCYQLEGNIAIKKEVIQINNLFYILEK